MIPITTIAIVQFHFADDDATRQIHDVYAIDDVDIDNLPRGVIIGTAELYDCDGTVNTLGIGQVNTHFGPWIAAGLPTARYVYHPSEIAGQPTFGSSYPRCAYFATCDAATYFLDMANIDKRTLQSLTARADGRPIDRKSVGFYRTAIEWRAAQPDQR